MTRISDLLLIPIDVPSPVMGPGYMETSPEAHRLAGKKQLDKTIMVPKKGMLGPSRRALQQFPWKLSPSWAAVARDGWGRGADMSEERLQASFRRYHQIGILKRFQWKCSFPLRFSLVMPWSDWSLDHWFVSCVFFVRKFLWLENASFENCM